MGLILQVLSPREMGLHKAVAIEAVFLKLQAVIGRLIAMFLVALTAREALTCSV